MKTGKLFLAAALATTMGCQSAPAVADVDVHISLGGPRAIAYHPIYHSDYFYNAGYAPNLLFVPQLGFYVSVGLPYDLLFFDNFYYVYHNDHWYHSQYYRGPWVVVKHNRLPRAIKKHRWHTIRDYCDREYRRHNKHRWLKHRNEVYKENRRGIRSSAFYHAAPHNSQKVYREKTERERQKAYMISEHERRKAYRVRSEKERRKTYKVRSEPEKRFIYKEQKKTKTWRKNPDERVVVKEQTTTTKRWIKREDNAGRKDKHWVENKANSSENHYIRRRDRSHSEKKVYHKKAVVERENRRWTRGSVSQ